VKTYVGTKIIQAAPAMESECNAMEEKQENRHGYKVVYPDGYTSWSPKDVFESAYREITDSEKKLI